MPDIAQKIEQHGNFENRRYLIHFKDIRYAILDIDIENARKKT
jgi:hypothetical protein